MPVLAGVGGMSTREGIEHALIGKNAGADGLMIASPAYSVPTQDEIADHMRAVVDAAGIPAVLYDYPSRIGVSIEAEALDVLADHPLIVGIKEATANLERAQWLIHDAPKGFAIYSGDDGTAVALMLCGGHGNVSVSANLVPKQMHELCVAAMAGRAQEAMAIQMALLPLHKLLFTEANPIPVKWAAARMGLCQGALRLPMTPLSAPLQPALESAMRSCGLI